LRAGDQLFRDARALLSGLIFYSLMGGLFHHNLWGNQGAAAQCR